MNQDTEESIMLFKERMSIESAKQAMEEQYVYMMNPHKDRSGSKPSIDKRKKTSRNKARAAKKSKRRNQR